MTNEAPERIWANPEGEYGQGFDAITLSTWNEVKEYSDATEYTRADLHDKLTAENAALKARVEALERALRFIGCSENAEGKLARAALSPEKEG